MTDAVVRDNHDRQRYEIVQDDEVAGFVDYERFGDQLILVNTQVVFPGTEGNGLASRMIRTVLDDARAAGVRVATVCPWVTEWLTRHPEYGDVEVRVIE
ncbi:GNAT family N-acetyltransferase [Nocardioides ginsengisoli]|uniref:GNAT family N-acetyltransferase n=1 Tax=Nocardioides ginsengisoli TaxID=363868 RepID=A0ABW3W1L5_9ACTN